MEQFVLRLQYWLQSLDDLFDDATSGHGDGGSSAGGRNLPDSSSSSSRFDSQMGSLMLPEDLRLRERPMTVSTTVRLLPTVRSHMNSHIGGRRELLVAL